MKKLTLATLALLTTVGAAHADQVLQEKNYGSFKACAAVNGIALADLKAQGIPGEVIVNAGGQYIAKVSINGKSGLLLCDGGHQQIVLVGK